MEEPKFLDAWLDPKWAIGGCFDLSFWPRLWIQIGPFCGAIDFGVFK